MLVDEFLIVGDERFGDGLSNGVDLRCVTTTGDANANVDVGELVETDNEEGFVDLRNKPCLAFQHYNDQCAFQRETVDDRPIVRLACEGIVVDCGSGDKNSSYLEAQNLGLDERQGLSVNFDQTAANLKITEDSSAKSQPIVNPLPHLIFHHFEFPRRAALTLQ